MHTDQADDFQNAVREGRIYQEPDGCMVIDDPPAGAQMSTPAVAAWAALLQEAKDRADRAEQERDAARQERDDRIIAELADARRQAAADPEVYARARLAMLRGLQNISTPGAVLWKAVDRLAAALGMGWTTDDYGVAVLAAAADRLTPPPTTYDWERYRRTCDPDLQLDGLGDLCAFLGGTWPPSHAPGSGSFTAGLLKLIAKADPGRLARLEAGFPREVLAWRTWMGMSPTPTAAQLAAELRGAS